MLELRSRPVRRVLLWHPDAIDAVFRTDARMGHSPSRTLAPLLGQRSLLWAQGERHTAFRRLLGPSLRGSQLPAYRGVISETAHAAVDELAVGNTFALPKWTRTVTLRIIGRIVLGHADEALLTRFTQWTERALGSRGRTLVYRYLAGGLPRSGKELDELLLRSAKATAHADPPTLATLLLDEGGPFGALDDDDLRDQIVSLLFAGHETTASAIAWTLLWLHRDEQVRRDVCAELAATSDDGSDASRVPLLQAVVQEALRLSPPATLAGNRVATENTELLDEPIAAGTILTPSIYLAQRQPDGFADARRFVPGRFFGRRPVSAQYFPFGGGVRRCLGSALAMLEIRMITACVLRRLELRCVNPAAGVPRLRGPAMAPAAGLRMAVTGRHT